jgi:hypothetical protein
MSHHTQLPISLLPALSPESHMPIGPWTPQIQSVPNWAQQSPSPPHLVYLLLSLS